MMVPLDDPPAGWPAPILAKRKIEARAAKAANETARKTAKTVGPTWRGTDLPARRRRPRRGGRAMTDRETKAGHRVAQTVAGGEGKPARRREVGLRAFTSQF